MYVRYSVLAAPIADEMKPVCCARFRGVGKPCGESSTLCVPFCSLQLNPPLPPRKEPPHLQSQPGSSSPFLSCACSQQLRTACSSSCAEDSPAAVPCGDSQAVAVLVGLRAQVQSFCGRSNDGNSHLQVESRYLGSYTRVHRVLHFCTRRFL